MPAKNPAAFTPWFRGGSGPPLVCLHGFTGTWRVWELVLGALERHHDVLALTLPGHTGGPPLGEAPTTSGLLDELERMLDEHGLATAHLVGNSLGGYLALHLAARGRAESVVAFAPAGGWAVGDESFRDAVTRFAVWQAELRNVAPYADALVRTPAGRRQATLALTASFEHIPAELITHQLRGTASCPGVGPLIETALREGYQLNAERVTCPVRIVWGTEDRLLPWPASAARYRRDWFPHADWVELDGVGHCPQLDVPLEAAELILGFTTPRR